MALPLITLLSTRRRAPAATRMKAYYPSRRFTARLVTNSLLVARPGSHPLRSGFITPWSPEISAAPASSAFRRKKEEWYSATAGSCRPISMKECRRSYAEDQTFRFRKVQWTSCKTSNTLIFLHFSGMGGKKRWKDTGLRG